MTDQSNLRHQPFVTVSGAHGGNLPVVDNELSSLEQENDTTTSLDENSIEFDFQTDRNVYLDFRQTYLALKIELVKSRCFDTYKTTGKEVGDDDVEFIKEEGEGVPHITHVNKILHSIFSIVELYIKNHQIYKSNRLYAHKLHIANIFENTLTDYKEVLNCERYEYDEVLMKAHFY